MKTWKVRSIGILTLGGSVLGSGLMAYAAFQAWPNILVMTLLVLFMLVYLYGIGLGVDIFRRTDKSLANAVPFWIAQVPLFTSKYVSYKFATGGAVWLSLSEAWTINFSPYIGSYAILNIGIDETASAGVNILALVIVIALLKHKHVSPDPGSENTDSNPL